MILCFLHMQGPAAICNKPVHKYIPEARRAIRAGGHNRMLISQLRSLLISERPNWPMCLNNQLVRDDESITGKQVWRRGRSGSSASQRLRSGGLPQPSSPLPLRRQERTPSARCATRVCATHVCATTTTQLKACILTPQFKAFGYLRLNLHACTLLRDHVD